MPIKRFYRPVSPWRINQKFGQNNVCVDNATSKITIPCDGLNPPPGYRSVYSQMKGHNGLDLMALRWQPVYAAREGRVIEKSTELERGLGVGILHGPYDGKYYKTRYWHLIAMDVDIGDSIYTGGLVGYADNTGYSTDDHLHFEVKECDSQGNTINNDNGFFGGIDPEPLLFDDFARDVNTTRALLEKLALMLDKLTDTLRGR